MTGILIQPPNTMPRINSIWAFVSVDAKDGNEGVLAATIGGVFMRLKSLLPIAEQIAQASGMTVKLVEFTERKEVRTLGGTQ